MSQLYSSLPDIHKWGKNNKVWKVRVWVSIFVINYEVWRIENHKKAWNDENISDNVPWHSLAYPSVYIVTAITYEWLKNGINNLPNQYNKSSVMMLQLDCFNKVNGTIWVPNSDD